MSGIQGDQMSLRNLSPKMMKPNPFLTKLILTFDRSPNVWATLVIKKALKSKQLVNRQKFGQSGHPGAEDGKPIF
jgi:hypothetical protein